MIEKTFRIKEIKDIAYGVLTELPEYGQLTVKEFELLTTFVVKLSTKLTKLDLKSYRLQKLIEEGI